MNSLQKRSINSVKAQENSIGPHSPLEEKMAYLFKMAAEMHSADSDLKDLVSTPRSSDRGELKKKLNRTLIAFELDTHIALAQTTGEDYRTFAVEYYHNIVQEYDCQTPSEKAMAETVASAFVRQLRIAAKLEEIINNGTVNADINAYIANLSKELDRATRTHINALMALKQLKNPPLKLNINARTAFVAQNQQFNTDDRQYENIIP